jgi:CheY-like chemotaxis protein
VGKRILVVEDDTTISDLIVTLVEAEGYESVSAYDGETAVQVARQQHPDLITLDLALPRKDGHEVLHELEASEETRGIPVVVVSAYTNRLSLHDMQRAAYVIGKPFDVDDFISKINHALANGHDQAWLMPR